MSDCEFLKVKCNNCGVEIPCKYAADGWIGMSPSRCDACADAVSEALDKRRCAENILPPPPEPEMIVGRDANGVYKTAMFRGEDKDLSDVFWLPVSKVSKYLAKMNGKDNDV